MKTNKGIETLVVRCNILVDLLLKGERKIPVICQVHRRPVLPNKGYEGGEKRERSKELCKSGMTVAGLRHAGVLEVISSSLEEPCGFIWNVSI